MNFQKCYVNYIFKILQSIRKWSESTRSFRRTCELHWQRFYPEQGAASSHHLCFNDGMSFHPFCFYFLTVSVCVSCCSLSFFCSCCSKSSPREAVGSLYYAHSSEQDAWDCFRTKEWKKERRHATVLDSAKCSTLHNTNRYISVIIHTNEPLLIQICAWLVHAR